MKELYYHTRDVKLLLKVGLSILAIGFLTALGIIFSKGHLGSERFFLYEYEQVLADLQQVQSERALADWLCGYGSFLDEAKEVDLPESLSLRSALDLSTLSAALTPICQQMQRTYTEKLDTLVRDPQRRALFIDFIATTQGDSDGDKIQQMALQSVPLANELLGSLHQRADSPEEALACYMKEASLPDAVQARTKALDLALELENVDAVLNLQAQTNAIQEATGWRLTEVGILLKDLGIQFRGGLSSLFEKTSLPILLLALFTAALWYLVLMRYRSQNELTELRWWWGLLPFAAGILSIIPTVWMAIFQEQVLKLKESGGTMELIKYCVLGIGMREEVAKMLLMLPFMPWLLKKRSAGLALMVGALIGLGFAFEENTGYIFGGDEITAFVRLFSANFMHVAMSGLCSLALYELLRSRFGSVQTFLQWVGAIVLAHGVYDWAYTGVVETSAIGSLGLISIVILALLAQHFFRHVNELLHPQRMNVSATSILIWGAATLGAVGFIGAASMGLGSAGVAQAGISMLEMLPVCIMHVRHLRMI